MFAGADRPWSRRWPGLKELPDLLVEKLLRGQVEKTVLAALDTGENRIVWGGRGVRCLGGDAALARTLDPPSCISAMSGGDDDGHLPSPSGISTAGSW